MKTPFTESSAIRCFSHSRSSFGPFCRTRSMLPFYPARPEQGECAARVGRYLSVRLDHCAGMKQIESPNCMSNVIAVFGAAILVKQPNGKLELCGGTHADFIEAR